MEECLSLPFKKSAWFQQGRKHVNYNASMRLYNSWMRVDQKMQRRQRSILMFDTSVLLIPKVAIKIHKKNCCAFPAVSYFLKFSP